MPAAATAGAVADGRLTLDTDAVSPLRFISAHGRKALVAGYASQSLEVWAYPFQIVSGYRVQFRAAGSTTAIRGEEILRRVTTEPESVTRTYIGPDFIVREKLFVPLDEAGAIVTYKVESSHSIEIEIHATPVLDLMWPGGLGGQSASWNSELSAFELSEPMDGYSAAVGSPEIVAHDEIANRTAGGENANSLGFTLRPDGAGMARVYIALNRPKAADTGAVLKQLIRDRSSLEASAAAHLSEVEDAAIHVETPDAQVNQAIAWAEIALDQAWVCNPDLGCGYVAGYGPSRGARRPQYDWFFAGDGLVSAEAAMAVSDNAKARLELEFVLHYQDRKTGMIWHELSQSAGLIDWANDFPYMFVHVDITFQFLSALEHYVNVSGDVGFARDHWKSIESAYRYCHSTIDSTSGLPRIPDDKEGGNEQDRVTDELGLSTSWVEASKAFADLAAMTGHPGLADEANRASQVAHSAIAPRYWSARRSFWVSGYNAIGEGEPEWRSGPGEAITLHEFNADQSRDLLDKLASASFQTDWGSRSVASDSPGYDPGSYAKGSVWAVGTASLAKTFWASHRSATALQLWRALLPWQGLDSLGHMDEVLAGNVYRAQNESVPEQTWSPAGFLDATVHGLLGLNVDSIQGRIDFAPHMPARWNQISVERVLLSNVAVGLTVRRMAHGLGLTIDNPGPPFKFEFAPEVPLGSRIGNARLDHKEVAVSPESDAQRAIARVLFDAPHGKSELDIELKGGVQVIAELPAPMVGMPSRGVHVVDVRLEGSTLTITADVPRASTSHIQLQTDWGVVKTEGAAASPSMDGLVDLTFAQSIPNAAPVDPYRRAKAVVQLKP